MHEVSSHKFCQNDSLLQPIFLYRITSVQAEVILSHFVAKPINAGLGALYGLLILHMLSASVHCTDYSFFICCQPRCTARTIHSSYAVSLGALHGLFILHMLSASVHYTDYSFFICCQPRCTEPM
jgi:hypothetical protein